jgi:FkbH-like protein
MIGIAEELNIGLDSLVFIDDNPDERERMRQLLPDVLTVEMPRDPAQYRAVVERLPQLQTLSITDEDRSRAAQYQAIRLREQAKSTAGNVADYLASLEISVRIAKASRSVYARVAQLFNKTNQFNTTTRRYSAEDVERFAADPDLRLWVLYSNDRFGDHGLVAVALVRCGPTRWVIDDFLMSCRVIGYGIESTFITFIANRARAAGARELVGEFIETKKNVPASDLYARHGFTRTDASSALQEWVLPLSDEIPFPDWIVRNDHDA